MIQRVRGSQFQRGHFFSFDPVELIDVIKDACLQ